MTHITTQPNNIRIPKWGVEEMTGYEPKTTFWQDFSIAERFGLEAIQDTFNRAFEEWKEDYIYLTELVMVLNWKCWTWCDIGVESASRLYQRLFYQAQDYAMGNLKDEELDYFYRITD